MIIPILICFMLPIWANAQFRLAQVCSKALCEADLCLANLASLQLASPISK